ncbi:acyl carrier protein [bacterium]|nr:acyl carrier protein [bacterium]
MGKVSQNNRDQEIHQDIIEVLSKITRIDASSINDDVLIRDELGIDSLMGIEIIAKVEKHYNIHIEESLLLEINRVGDFINLVKSKLK